jgi:hypothetical protein
MPVQRRARDHDGRMVEPMTLANMRAQGVRSIFATCNVCQHEAVLDADQRPAEMPVPEIGCSAENLSAHIPCPASSITHRRHSGLFQNLPPTSLNDSPAR